MDRHNHSVFSPVHICQAPFQFFRFISGGWCLAGDVVQIPGYWLRNSFTGKTLLSVGFIDRSQNTGIEAVCVGNLMRSCVLSTYTQTSCFIFLFYSFAK